MSANFDWLKCLHHYAKWGKKIFIYAIAPSHSSGPRSIIVYSLLDLTVDASAFRRDCDLDTPSKCASDLLTELASRYAGVKCISLTTFYGQERKKSWNYIAPERHLAEGLRSYSWRIPRVVFFF